MYIYDKIKYCNRNFIGTMCSFIFRQKENYEEKYIFYLKVLYNAHVEVVLNPLVH